MATGNGESRNGNVFQPLSWKWPELIPAGQWAIYHRAIAIAREANVPFLLGGAFGLAAYTGRWRNTKDIDFFIRAADRQRLIDDLTQAGFEDYYGKLAYDRSWIYRATRDGVIVDLIWTLPNHRTVVDEDWFKHCRIVEMRGESVGVVPAEELLWIKLYVMQRDRCDWPDVINLLCAVGPELDWDRLSQRLGNDDPLLHSALLLFGWVCPARAAKLPETVRARFGLPAGEGGSCDDLERERVGLLDSRRWYAAFQPENEPMQL